MSLVPRKTAQKIKSKLLSEIVADINLLNDRINDLQSRTDEINNSLLRINQHNSRNNVQTLPISHDEVLTKIFTDLKIYLNPNDMAVAAHIALDGVWEREITKAWMSVIKPDYTVLDIGANFGYYGLLAGQFTSKKKANVILFEANKKLIPYINKSISINWFNEQVKVENLAVSDKNETVVLNVLKDYVGSSSLQTLEELDTYMHEKMQLVIEEKMKVQSITIDNYCSQEKIKAVNLIKMDIEGFEEKAYSGMRQIVKKSKDITLFIEFTKDSYENPRKFYDQMLGDFGNVYTINAEGELIKPKDAGYASVIGEADDWVMPVFSKNPDLIGK